MRTSEKSPQISKKKSDNPIDKKGAGHELHPNRRAAPAENMEGLHVISHRESQMKTSMQCAHGTGDIKATEILTRCLSTGLENQKKSGRIY